MRYDRERQEARVLEIGRELKRVARLIQYQYEKRGEPYRTTIEILDKLLRDLDRECRFLLLDCAAEKR